MPETLKPEWIAADWDATRLRLWAMREGQILDLRQSDIDGDVLSFGEAEAILLAQSKPWLKDRPLPVVMCGTTGMRGTADAVPEHQIPAKPLDMGAVRTPTQDDRLTVFLCPGLKQTTPPDLMYGDVTRIAGFLSLNAQWDGVICLPGRHSRWAHVSAGEIVSFQTFLTGELFAALGSHTALRHFLDGNGWDDAVFQEALSDAMARPERLAAQLFSLYVGGLLYKTAPDTTRARLSGILIGAELAAARPYWLGHNIAVLDRGPPSLHYAEALRQQGVPVTIADATRMTIAGLTEAYRVLSW